MGRRRRQVPLLILLGLALVASAFIVRIQVSPWYVGMGDDSGFFAVGGQRILSGDLLYRDIWDTKPPGVFYLNALAISVGGPNPWSIWWLETVWISITIIALVLILGKLAGVLPAILATILFTFTALHPELVGGGNFTELYALLPIVLTLGAIVAYFSSAKYGWIASIGVLTAVAFIFKQNTIALGVASLAAALLEAIRGPNWRKALMVLGAFVIGFLPLVLLIGGYWAQRGALEDLWSVLFRQSFVYIQEGSSLSGIYATARKFVVEQPIAALSLISAASLAVFMVRSRPQDLGNWPAPGSGAGPSRHGLKKNDWVFLAAFLSLPLEVLLIALSGRSFGHYFLVPLPAMAAASTYLFAAILAGTPRVRARDPWLAPLLAVLALVIGAWGIDVIGKQAPERAHLSDLLSRPLHGWFWTDSLEQYVVESTMPEDTILVWDYNPGVHFLTGRRSPSPVLIHPQLFTPGLVSVDPFARLTRDIAANPPVLILARLNSPHLIPYFGAESGDPCPDCTPEAKQGIREIRALTEDQYRLEESIGDYVIYRKR
ncbi:MAG: glycosyltransferase family 39 protein [Chloroflexi bacterium]|nr:glycosyltransferase family 39 protein [Chloroflexota bacterium]